MHSSKYTSTNRENFWMNKKEYDETGKDVLKKCF